MTARLAMAKLVSESDWQGWVVATAQLLGWSTYHSYDSRKSNAGWPDLVLVRPPELVIAELKSEAGKITPAQQKWLDDLAACGVESALWRPSDQPTVLERLQRPSSGLGGAA